MAQLKARWKEALHSHSVFGKIAEIAGKRTQTYRAKWNSAISEEKSLIAQGEYLRTHQSTQRQRDDNDRLLTLCRRRIRRSKARYDFWQKRLAWAYERHHHWGAVLRRRRDQLRAWLHLHQYYGAGGFAPGRFWVRQREDQGQDIEIRINQRLRAPGDGEVIGWGHDAPFPSGFGDPYPVIRIDTGDFKGLELYLGHANVDVPAVGTKFIEGDKLSRANNSLNRGLGWVEIGLWPVEPWDGVSLPSPGHKIAHLFKEVRA